MKAWQLIIIHQILFQGMFFIKNILLHKNTGSSVRGNNPEAQVSIVFFVIYITLSICFAGLLSPAWSVSLLDPAVAMAAALFLMFASLVISALSLIQMKDSWRVGVLKNQETALVTSGVYRFSRNPYFVSYLLMLFSYALLLQNMLLLGLFLLGFACIHIMIKKEEHFLTGLHGDLYLQYKQSIPRYLIF
jgi:protein-S-isoprenylcysteine O-methyltransferase Ste14